MATFHSLKVEEIIQNTPNSVTVSFDIPKNLKDEFSFVPGQYITIKKSLNNTELRRAYSICSTPESNTLKIGIKKVEEGTFSRYANANLKEGDFLEVATPEGKFTLTAQNIKRNIVAFAAGSGITPVMSIMKSVLTQEPDSNFVLVYGNKTTEETMFYREIKDLIQKYPNQLSVYFFNSREESEDSIFGRIERSTVNFVLKNKHKNQSFDAYYLCGPEAMIETVSTVLKESNVPENDIKFELFTTSNGNDNTENVKDGQAKITVIVDDEETSFVADKSMRLLDAALGQKIDAPYSCQGGICSSCIAKVTQGKAEMAQNQILTDKEVEEGLILTCQAHAVSDTITVDYDDV